MEILRYFSAAKWFVSSGTFRTKRRQGSKRRFAKRQAQTFSHRMCTRKRVKVSRAFAIPVKLQPGLNAICQKVTVDSGVLARTWALKRNEGESAKCDRSENSQVARSVLPRRCELGRVAVDFSAEMGIRKSEAASSGRFHLGLHPNPTWRPMRCHAGLPPPQAKRGTGESSPRFPAQGVTAEFPLPIPLPPVLGDGSLGTGAGTGHASRLGTTSCLLIALKLA